MRPIIVKLKPTGGFAYFLHILLVLIVPILALVLVSLNFVQLALSIIVLSKWRMFAVRPRFWAANIRANAIDLMVGLSIVAFMSHSDSFVVRLVWAALYSVWLLYIKPSSSDIMVASQAFIGQLFALIALYLTWASGPIYGLTLLTGLFCYLAARHFLETFEEPYSRLIAYTWGYFGAALAWLLSHWLIYYKNISQVTVFLSVIGYGIAVLYYLDHFNKLNKTYKRVIISSMVVIVVAMIAFSGWWGDKVV
ncbi:MAG TPA: hypothetical protein VL989_03780 [Candidatus Sulfotelmatobacter sp.]|nr:hypothetical protein [Candidatus Sulfotelmatobacter sp.]